MKKILFFLVLTVCFSCKNEPKPVGMESLKLDKKEGVDCDKPDTLRTNCAEIALSYPSVKDGSEPLKKAVADWTRQFLTGLLSPEADSTALLTMTVETAAQGFFELHKNWTKESPDALAYYTTIISDTVLLNDGKLLTPVMTGYNYLGGAHGMSYTIAATFDAASGKQLSWTDLVTDTTALKALAEKKFREVRADIFKPEDGSEGFAFDESFPFKLPDNYGLTDQGIFFCYLHYEVTPYAYGSTDFVLTFAELGALRKLGN